MIDATSSVLSGLSYIRIFAVTGTETASEVCLIISAITSGVDSRAAPHPRLMSLWAGQPKLMSISCGAYLISTMRAALTKLSTVAPDSCTAKGRSSSHDKILVRILLPSYNIPSESAISEYTNAAPYRLHIRRNGRLVTFAIGASRTCLLYTSDAADEEDSVDLGGRRSI